MLSLKVSAEIIRLPKVFLLRVLASRAVKNRNRRILLDYRPAESLSFKLFRVSLCGLITNSATGKRVTTVYDIKAKASN